MPTAPVHGGDPYDLLAGGFPGWALPPDAGGVGIARSVAKRVLAVVGMSEALAYDAMVAVSELVTNVYLHTRGGADAARWPAAPPEMWAYLRPRPCPELVVKVFDTGPWTGPVGGAPPRPAPMAENGRGLEVVHALITGHGGRWGVHRTHSRLTGCPVPGKAAFIALPLPPGTSPSRVARTPEEVADDVHALLAARGMDRLLRTTDHGMTVICVRAGVHVWVRADSISYCVPGRPGARVGRYDVVEAVEQVVCHCAELDHLDAAVR